MQSLHDLSAIWDLQRLQVWLDPVEREGLGRHVPKDCIQVQIHRSGFVWLRLGVLQNDLPIPADGPNDLAKQTLDRIFALQT